jgi:4-hydroxy-3-methylbut-2-enyl diphosphate reductase
VRHEIVHNVHVVDRLRALGAVFVEDLAEAPDDRPVIFSAHGVPRAVPAEAKRRNMFYLDATCPLVSKVHVEINRHDAAGREIILIGHAGHPEVLGAIGQLPDGRITVVETVDDVALLEPRDPEKLAFVTQTTLSVDDTAEIVAALLRRFPKAAAPRKEDICYATTNRQEAVKKIAPMCELMLVVGSETSSNSQRLVEVARQAGAPDARLIDDATHLDWRWFEHVKKVGLTAGASAPDLLVQEVIEKLAERFEVETEEVDPRQESVTFKLPRAVAV